MPKPIHYTYAARTGLAVGGLALAVGLAGPFQGPGSLADVMGPEGRFAAWFVMSILAFLSAPRVRRNDIALYAVALAAALELLRGAVGEGALVSNVVFEAVGVLFAWMPSAAETLRHAARRSPYVAQRDYRSYGLGPTPFQMETPAAAE